MATPINLKKLLLLYPFLVGAYAGVVPSAKRVVNNALRLETHEFQAFAKPAANVATDNHVRIERSANTSPRGAHYLGRYREQQRARKQPPSQAGTDNNSSSGSGVGTLTDVQGVEYIMGINYQGTDVKVIVDTGSSDTWLVESDFQCLNSNGQKVSQKTCNFGSTYPGSYKKKSLGQLQISYGDGEYCNGYFGKANVTVAGITVPQVESALVNSAYWNGDGVTSGLMGLGYPGLTSNYVNGVRKTYDPIFTTMYKDGLSSAMFSMAIERGTNGGYIAFGGLPPVAYDESTWSTTPIKKTTIFGGSTPQYGFYTMTPDALLYTGASSTNSDDYIVDSGTTLMYVPSAVASAINGLFSPPSPDGQSVSCNATAPSVGVKIGGKDFIINPADLILSNGDGTCISGVQGTSSAPYILGDTFMKSVVVAFDIGAAEMRFATSQY